MISAKHRDLHRLAAQVGKAGENELTEIRARRDQLWQLIRASAFEKSLSPEDAQKQSGSSEQLPGAFTEHLRRADQTADLRFANAKKSQFTISSLRKLIQLASNSSGSKENSSEWKARTMDCGSDGRVNGMRSAQRLSLL